MKDFYKYISGLFFLLAASTLPAQNLEELTLGTFLELAKEHALGKQVADANFEIAHLDDAIYKAQLKPQVTGYASFPNYAKSFREIIQPSGTIAFQPIRYNNAYASIYAEQPLQATGGAVFLQTDLQRFDDFEAGLNQYNGLPIRLGISQPLFQFNPWKWQKKLMPLRQQEATKKRAFDIASIEVEAGALYFNLLVAHQNLKIAETNQTNNKELLKIAKERFELGKISENDLLQLKLEEVLSARNKRTALQEVRTASTAIYNYLGPAFTGELIKAVIPVDFPVLPLQEQTILDKALHNNYLLDTYIRQQIEAEQALERSQKNAGLNMDLTASIGYARNGKNIGDIYTKPQQEQLVQLSIQVPILNWGQEKAVIQQQQLRVNLAEKQKEYFKNQFITQIKNLLYTIQDLQEQLQLAQQQQQIAIERFEITRKSFVLGAISTTELGIAQQEKDFALRDYILTLSNYWSSYFALKQSALLE